MSDFSKVWQEQDIRNDVNKEFGHLSIEERESIIRSRALIILNSNKPELIKADMGPYASQIFKFTIYNEENFMENPLKFIHINNDKTNQNNPNLSIKEKRENRSRTVAVLSLSPNSIRKIATEYVNSTDKDVFVQMYVGVQVVSLEDNYNKKKGRDLSVSKMKEVELQVMELIMKGDFIKIRLETHENITLVLRLNKKTGFSTVYGKLTV